MSEQRCENWRPERYITGKLHENELVNTDLEPWEPGMKGIAVDLPDGRRVEVFFTLPMLNKTQREYMRVQPSEGDMCAAVVEMYGWLTGKEPTEN